MLFAAGGPYCSSVSKGVGGNDLETGGGGGGKSSESHSYKFNDFSEH